MTASLPGPRPAPLLGQAGNILAFMRDPLAFMMRLHHTYGDIAAVTRNCSDHVFVFSPPLNAQVLGDAAAFHTIKVPFPIPPGTPLARLFTIPGQLNGLENKQQRQVMFAALHQKYYETYRAGLIEVVEQRLAGWQVGQVRDIAVEMNELALRTPVRAIFGLEPDGREAALVDLLRQWGETLVNLRTSLLPLNWPGLPYRRLLRLSAALEAAYLALIDRWRASGLTGDDALTMLIRRHDAEPDRLSQAHLIGQINNLLNAGNTSRATILTWTLFLLAQHPAALAGVRHELARRMSGPAPTLAELEHLPLLEAALKESMRLLPPINWFSRRAMVPIELGPYDLPAGATVMVSPLVTHRRPELYPAPRRFLPERWLTTNPGVYGYLPLGAGPRACVGANVAMLEMKLVLAMILTRYQLSPLPQTAIDRAGMMLTFPRAMPMTIGPPDQHPRQQPVTGNIHDLVELS